MRFPFRLLLLVVLVSGCGKSLPSLEGIDTEKWKEDKNACLGSRQSMEPALKAEMAKLKGLKEMDIIKLLGRPDQNELYKRNQKFFYYQITPGTACQKPDSSAHKLVLRFNAMGFAQLVSIEM